MTLSAGTRTVVESRISGRPWSNETPVASLIVVSEGRDCVRGARRPDVHDGASEVGVGDVEYG